MKPLLMILAGLLLVGTATAAELQTSNGPTYIGTLAGERTPVTITQNFDITTIGNTQVACGNNLFVYTTQNWFLRRFFLFEDHSIAAPISVVSVDWSVSQFASDSSPIPAYSAAVVLHTINNGAAFTFANMTEVARVNVPLTIADLGTFKNTLISTSITDPVGTDLVVSIDAPDGSVTPTIAFRPGANSAGALRDAYIAAADCGINDPTGVSAIGFPTSQTIFVVNAETGVPAEVTSWGAVKNLYR